MESNQVKQMIGKKITQNEKRLRELNDSIKCSNLSNLIHNLRVPEGEKILKRKFILRKKIAENFSNV